MATYSKRVKIHPNVLLEYIFDDSNFKSEDYNILTNLKETTKSFLSTTNNNNSDKNLFLVDPILSKYSVIDLDSYNFLRLQNYFTPAIPYDRLVIHFPSGFDFYDDYLGFYINVFVNGYGTNNKYSLTNYHYLKSNIDSITEFNLNTPFYYDEQFWVRSIELEIPSVNHISADRYIKNDINVPTSNSINDKLTYGEGIATNSPIFIDFSFISSTQTVLDIPYYYTSKPYGVSIPQVPEYSEVGVDVIESEQGDYFEICGTYKGSNENMDEFAYSENIKGNEIQLEYVVNLYEENIITSTQTFQVTENFTNKILYRPVIQFSNTTASIDVELKIVSVVDSSYISKFGSLGVTDSINKYGLRLTRLNMDSGVINPEIFNLKVRNTMSVTGSIDNGTETLKVPYPVMVDRYRVLSKTTNSSTQTNSYIPNGLLEILITSFDNVIEFNIAQDINSNGEPVPYNLSEISTNSKLMLVFKSDSEKLEKEPFYEADNNYEIGNISYKIQETDYKTLKRIYNKGYDNFYLVVKSTTNTSTQLYSGKFVFYEDVTFIEETTKSSSSTASTTTDGTTTDEATVTDNVVSDTSDTVVINTETIDDPEIKIDKIVTENNPFIKDNMPTYTENTSDDKNYTNLMVYVRYQTNMEQMDAYLVENSITAKIQYGNVYYIERVYQTVVDEFKKQLFIDQVFEIPIGSGQAPKTITKETDNAKSLQVYKEPETSSTDPNSVSNQPSKPTLRFDKYNSSLINKNSNDDTLK